jgi:hypothetical protein
MTVSEEQKSAGRFVGQLATAALAAGWENVSVLVSQGGAIGITVQDADTPWAYSKTTSALERTEYAGGDDSLIEFILGELVRLKESAPDPEELPVVDPDQEPPE